MVLVIQMILELSNKRIVNVLSIFIHLNTSIHRIIRDNIYLGFMSLSIPICETRHSLNFQPKLTLIIINIYRIFTLTIYAKWILPKYLNISSFKKFGKSIQKCSLISLKRKILISFPYFMAALQVIQQINPMIFDTIHINISWEIFSQRILNWNILIVTVEIIQVVDGKIYLGSICGFR